MAINLFQGERPNVSPSMCEPLERLEAPGLASWIGAGSFAAILATVVIVTIAIL